MKLNELTVDAEREEHGDWIDHPEDSTFKVKVRSPHSRVYKRALEDEKRRLARKHGGYANIPRDIIDDAENRIYAEHLLIDWQGLEDEDGNAIEYSPERAVKMATDHRYRKLVAFIAWASSRVGEIESEELEADAKN